MRRLSMSMPTSSLSDSIEPMNFLLKLLLIILFPLLVLARLLNALLRRDPLRLREPAGSCWIERDAVPDTASYFTECSQAEGRGHDGLGDLAARPLRAVARLMAPSRPVPGEKLTAAADREQGIPDEVYTLW